MLSQRNRDELLEKGYTVVPEVLTEAECDNSIRYFRNWLSAFPPGTWPQTSHSLIAKYHSGHMEPAWLARIKAYPVFSQLWHTNKLLSSMDTVSIGRPPEDGQEEFWSEGQSWLHCDQSADRIGLHGYQGGVYFEHCADDDWTFEVVESSHKHFEELMDNLQVLRCSKLTEENIQWLVEKGCSLKRVPCPKGGLVLWDCRLIHANARPLKGRANPGRWRFVAFVSMTPAAWTTEEDLKQKATAYNNLELTNHWPSRGVFQFSSKLKEGSVEDPNPLEKLPGIATTDVAKRLVGLLPYDVAINDEEERKALKYVPQFDEERCTRLDKSMGKGPTLQP